MEVQVLHDMAVNLSSWLEGHFRWRSGLPHAPLKGFGEAAGIAEACMCKMSFRLHGGFARGVVIMGQTRFGSQSLPSQSEESLFGFCAFQAVFNLTGSWCCGESVTRTSRAKKKQQQKSWFPCSHVSSSLARSEPRVSRASSHVHSTSFLLD